MPKRWDATIEGHRRAVRQAILDTTAELLAAHGLRSVTMSRIAEEAGIGRATLYKYFADVEAVLLAWHGRQIAAHLRELAEARDTVDDATGRLEAVLAAYARIARESSGHHDAELAAFLHRDEHVGHAEEHLHALVTELVSGAAEAGEVRRDVPAGELARYCVHAVAAARHLASEAAVRRLVTVVLAGLRPR